MVLRRRSSRTATWRCPERELGDLLAEELRRLDADQPYAEALGVAAGVTGLADRPDEPRTLIWVDPMQSDGRPVAAESSAASPAAVASAARGRPEAGRRGRAARPPRPRPRGRAGRRADRDRPPEGAPGPPADGRAHERARRRTARAGPADEGRPAGAAPAGPAEERG